MFQKYWFSSLVAIVALSACAPVTQNMEGRLSDAEIAGILVAANQGQIELNRLAVQKASSPEVRQFAQQMIDEHGEAGDNATALLNRLGVTPAETEASRNLRRNNQQTVEVLRKWEGEEFDRTFMNHEVTVHEFLSDTLENQLIPSARNRELRNFLTEVNRSVEHHLSDARRLAS